MQLSNSCKDQNDEYIKIIKDNSKIIAYVYFTEGDYNLAYDNIVNITTKLENIKVLPSENCEMSRKLNDELKSNNYIYATFGVLLATLMIIFINILSCYLFDSIYTILMFFIPVIMLKSYMLFDKKPKIYASILIIFLTIISVLLIICICLVYTTMELYSTDIIKSLDMTWKVFGNVETFKSIMKDSLNVMVFVGAGIIATFSMIYKENKKA